MANPNTRETLKQYALRNLGKPVIEINASDEQLEDRIDEALQYYAQYHYDGIRRTYLKYKLTAADKTRLKTANAISESATDGDVTTASNEDKNYLIVPESVVASKSWASIKVFIAFALAKVSSDPLTELISVSRTPLFKLSTSIKGSCKEYCGLK